MIYRLNAFENFDYAVQKKSNDARNFLDLILIITIILLIFIAPLGFINLFEVRADENATPAAINDATKFEIVFIGDNYTTSDLPRFREDTDRVKNFTLSIEPFKSRQHQIAFNKVENTTVDLGCVYGDQGEFGGDSFDIHCNSESAINVINNSGFAYDKIILLVNDSRYGGAVQYPISIAYNGEYATTIAVHELAHTLNVRDEYVPSGNGAGEIDQRTYGQCYAGTPPNLAWNGLAGANDYNLGCIYNNWYRSSACSIMQSAACSNFNLVSQKKLHSELDNFAGRNWHLDFNVDKNIIRQGEEIRLSWAKFDNQGTCNASGAWQGLKPSTGEQVLTPANGTSTYFITCTNSNDTTSSMVSADVDGQPPTVGITTPVGNSTVLPVQNTIKLEALASDDIEVTKVEFYVDDIKVGSVNTAAYTAFWYTNDSDRDTVNILEKEGPHQIYAIAYDLAGNQTKSEVIGIILDQPENTETRITSPPHGSTVYGGVVTFVAELVDPSSIGSVSKVCFYNTAYPSFDPIYCDQQAPFDYDWDTSDVPNNGRYIISAIAYDFRNIRYDLNDSVGVNLLLKLPRLKLLDPDVPTGSNLIEDGAVGVADIAKINSLFGKNEVTNAADWNKFKTYDLNFDGSISTVDISLLVSAFGVYNWPPVNASDKPVMLQANKLYQFYLSATDPDSTILPIISATGRPTNATFTSEDFTTVGGKKIKRAKFSWIPTTAQIGQTYKVEFSSDDGFCGQSCPKRELYLKVR